MVPANLQEKLAAFIQERQSTIRELIARIIAGGLSPEDQIFVIPAGDADSQKVTAIMFGLEKEAAAGPLPKGFVVGQADFLATAGMTLAECEPDVGRVIRSRKFGEAKILAVVEGCFCGVAAMYRPRGPLPVA